MTYEINFKKILTIIGVATSLGVFYNLISDNSVDFIRTEKVYKMVEDSSISIDLNQTIIEPRLISIEQAYQLFSSQSAIFIDSRDKWDFSDGHIPGAINIPEYNFDPGSKIVTNLDHKNLYIIYCNSDDCETSKKLANELLKLSFNKLLIFESGWDSWILKNYPIEKSELQ
ncbi:MAG: hypothetical protein A2V66_03385 [Ignavibacteria bacterium RBG_13_36_8]|nr:MAG: hypothetical protein A2V66_03385 [Ignavibacteria bacterium RBG_13_36_8]